MRTRASSYPDPETAQRCVQRIIDAHEPVIARWLAYDSAERLRLDGYWPAETTGSVQLAAMVYAGRGSVAVHGARVVLKRSDQQANGFVVLNSFPTLS